MAESESVQERVDRMRVWRTYQAEQKALSERRVKEKGGTLVEGPYHSFVVGEKSFEQLAKPNYVHKVFSSGIPGSIDEMTGDSRLNKFRTPYRGTGLVTDNPSKLIKDIESETGLILGPEAPNDTDACERVYPETGEEIHTYALYSKPGLLTNRQSVPLGIMEIASVPRSLFEQWRESGKLVQGIKIDLH